MESCCGCGVCEEVCPVADCITMVNEEAFTDNASQHDHWKEDRDGYMKWLDDMIHTAKSEKKTTAGRAHGFHEWGEYEQQIATTAVAK
jgi:formate hydrogenlyase subunit 6/NADH:ubiquinone oxidoreductase subunit I